MLILFNTLQMEWVDVRGRFICLQDHPLTIHSAW